VTSQNPDNGLSSDNRHHECRHVIDNAEAYALGALDHADRSGIEQHLMWCGPCRRAVAAARRATDLLPLLSDPATPSSAVKAQLFARVARDQDSSSAALPDPNPWVPKTDAPQDPAGAGRTSLSWQRWLPPALLAPLALVLLVTAAWANSLRNEVSYLESERRSQAAMANAVGGESDMQLYSFEPACPTCNDANGRFGGNPNGSIGVVVAWNLDPAEQHQVWCVDKEGEKWMVTDLEVEPSGSVFQTISFPQPLGGYQQIYVARNDGTADPDAELMVAMDKNAPDETPSSEPSAPWGS
jgi:hypothetical protein